MKQMILCTLMLLSLTAGVCGRICSLNYTAEENSNVTVEWSFSSRTDIPVNSLKIHCVMVHPTQEVKVFFSLDPSVVELQDEQFAGRVQCDTDALGAGRVRLHVSGLRTSDSGPYLCRMMTEEGRKGKEFSLNVTKATEKPKPVTPKPDPQTSKPAPEGRERVWLCAALGLTAAAALFVFLLKTKVKAGTERRRERSLTAAPCWRSCESGCWTETCSK